MFSFSFLIISAQTTESQSLNDSELATAKKLYIKMMNTDTYKQRIEKVMLFAKKSNRVMIFPDAKQRADMSPEDHRRYIKIK